LVQFFALAGQRETWAPSNPAPEIRSVSLNIVGVDAQYMEGAGAALLSSASSSKALMKPHFILQRTVSLSLALSIYEPNLPGPPVSILEFGGLPSCRLVAAGYACLES
jgi:hypothetical protein